MLCKQVQSPCHHYCTNQCSNALLYRAARARLAAKILCGHAQCDKPMPISFSNGRTQTFQMSYLPIIQLTVNLINRDLIQLTIY